MRAANDQASLYIRIVSPYNVWKFIFLWVARFAIYLREKWKKKTCIDDLGFSAYAQK